MTKINVKAGRHYLQVAECREGRSRNTGNEYWLLTFYVAPGPKSKRGVQIVWDPFPVFFTKKCAWQLQVLQRIVEVCGVNEPWELYGKRFVADVTVNENGYARLRNPKPYAEEEPRPEPAGINAPGECPW